MRTCGSMRELETGSPPGVARRVVGLGCLGIVLLFASSTAPVQGIESAPGQGEALDRQQLHVLREAFQLANTIGDDLFPILEAVGDTAAMIRDTATAIDDAIQAINNIPFVSLEKVSAEATIFAEIADSITAIETSIEETQKEVQDRREERVEDMVDRVTGRTDEWRGKVTGVQNTLGDADAALEESSNNLAALKISLPRTFMLITIAINLVFLLIGIAFLSLFFHGFSYIRNSDQSLNELLL